MQPPSHIDGARVLHWAWSDVPFGDVRFSDGRVAAVIHGIALCQYEGSADVYRFSCGPDWQCEQDQVYGSIQEAKDELPEQYQNAPAHWQAVA